MLPSVLLVTNEYPPDKVAGTAMSTQSLAEELASRGIRVTIVVNNRRMAAPHEVDQNLEVIRLRPINLPGTRMTQRAVLLINIARRIRPDIIQGQSLSCGCLALLAGRCLGIPVVTHIQGYDLYEAGLWERRTYIGWTLKHSDGLVAVTPDLRAKAYELSGRLGEVISNGVKAHTAQRFDREATRAQLCLPLDAKLVLFVGRLVPNKGVAHLLRAMVRVVAHYPGIRLVLVGEGEERRTLAGLTRKLSLEEHVMFAGQQPHEDVIRFMQAADIFVLPSLAEPFGIVLIEAMSCGLPIVASNVMGIPSIVVDGRNGFLTPPGDENALADRIMQLLVDPGERSAFGQENARKALDYAMPLIADRFVSLWKGALAKRRIGRKS